MAFSGIYTALVTPFNNGRIDEKALRTVVRAQVDQGVHGIVAVGCTGEAATLDNDEARFVWRTAVSEAQGRVPVIAGAGSNSTEFTIRQAQAAVAEGVDAVMLITPYYNKPTQEGLYRHYKAVSDKVSAPIMIYNVPGRTGIHMEPETVARLSHFENIVAIKEASGTIAASAWILKLARPGFVVLSGDDPLFLPLATIGVRGVVSVASNVVPGHMARMWESFLKGDIEGAAQIHMKLLPLFQALFVESNPIPVKAALAMMGQIQEEYRLPMTPMSEDNKRKLRPVLKDLGLLE
jgi:4-hydroxy-tetrahydrodipicolinate synthase